VIPYSFLLWLAIPHQSRDDLAFLAAQERWVQAASPASGPPEPASARVPLAFLGGPCQGCRDAVMRRIKRASYGDPRWLFWHARDPEIRWRQRRIAADVFACRTCRGQGVCLRFYGDEDRCANCGRWQGYHPRSWDDFTPSNCRACKGTGDLFGFTGWMSGG
jgi:hypothetical protein